MKVLIPAIMLGMLSGVFTDVANAGAKKLGVKNG